MGCGAGRQAIAWALSAGLLAGVLATPARAADDGPLPRSGMRAHIDPRTGALVEPPPGAAPAPLPAPRAQAGLIETPAPGGGVMVHLRGGFQSPLTATVAPDGSVHVEHRPDAR